jgi:glycosyltransferase involved in cell wall biosynthesis
MKVAYINTVLTGSTGKIMRETANLAKEMGAQIRLCVPKGRHNDINMAQDVLPIGNRFSEDLHILLGRITGLQGCFGVFATYRFLKRLKKFGPDILHLHNLHNCYINLPMLFRWIKKKNIKVVWTLHDCWSFTGHCPHFTVEKCNRWETGCYKCSKFRAYPQSYIDTSKMLFKAKKRWFTGVNDLTIVTPSRWLADLAKKSFLKDYPIITINNGIDIGNEGFMPIDSTFKRDYNIEDKYVVLGVAGAWSRDKGLDAFVELSKRLDKKFQVVLVGTSEKVDAGLPENIISIHKTQSKKQLAEIYSAADLFVNPTRADTFPTVNIEALACGTPVLTFETGGSPEIIDEACGSVVKCDDLDAFVNEIQRICTEKPYSKEACLKRSEDFDNKKCFEKYIKLYEEMLKKHKN